MGEYVKKPRILLCFSLGPEVAEHIARSRIFKEKRAEFVWWCKNSGSINIISEHISNPKFLVSSINNVRYPKFIKYNFKQFLEKKFFPDEWIQEVLAYNEQRYSHLGKQINEIDRFHAMSYISEAIRVIGMTQPDAILIKAATRIQEASFLLVAQEIGIPTVITERGPFPNSLFLDKNCIGPNILRPMPNITSERSYEDYLSEFIGDFLNSGESAWEQPKQNGSEKLYRHLDIPRDSKIIFYAAQVENDANMILFSHHFSSNEAFLDYVSQAVSGIKDAVLVVKPHPKEKKEIKNIGDRYGIRMIIDREINIKEMIKLASAIVTLNSTVGFEALLYDKPVAVGGKAYYSDRGFTFDICGSNGKAGIKGLHNFLSDPSLTDKQKNLLHMFINALMRNSVYFHEPTNGLNGPDQFVERILSIVNSGKTYRMPTSLVCSADHILSSCNEMTNIDSLKYKDTLFYILYRGLIQTAIYLRKKLVE